jgi:hypothetical protein
MTSQKVWSTSAPGTASSISTARRHRQPGAGLERAPYHEAVFPYPPLMAYYFGAIGGSTDRSSTAPGLDADTYSLEFGSRPAACCSRLANGVLIYLLARGMKLSRVVR